MNTAELIKKVRRIEIKTRHLSSDLFSGSYQSAFKGRGMSFSEVREYHYGDDVRNIDWNVTARMGEPFIKVFEEERELTVVLIVDMSASSLYGTQSDLRSDLITEISAVLAFSAEKNNDKIGALFFTEEIEKYIAPRKGKTHILKIIRELVNRDVQGKGTDLTKTLQYINNVLRKRSILFVLSDFLDDNYSDALNIVSRRHDVIGLRVMDPSERKLPKAGLMRLWDQEKDRFKIVNTSSRKVQKQHQEWMDEKNTYFESAFNRCSADRVDLTVGDPYILELIRLFKKRGH